MRPRKLRIKNDQLVVKSNLLVPVLAALSLNELRFLAFCLSKLSVNDTVFSSINVRAMEIAEMYNISVDSLYELLKGIVIRINSKPVPIDTDTKQGIVFWFSALYKNKSDGSYTFHFNDELKPYLLQLKENFTQYRIRDVYQFTSASSWHVYEVLRQYKNMKIREFELEEFKSLIGITGKYTQYTNFKNKLLEPALREVNALSDIFVEYEEQKRRSKIVKLTFFIVPNKENLHPVDRARLLTAGIKRKNPLPDVSRELVSAGVSTRNAYKLCLLIADRRKKTAVQKKLPELIARYQSKTDQKGTQGAYIYTSLRNMLSTPYLIDAVQDELQSDS